MATKKVSALAEVTSVNSTDVLYAVINPASTPVSKRITAANLMTSVIDVVASGTETVIAGNSSDVTYRLLAGPGAGDSNAENDLVAIGYRAGQSSTGVAQVCIGRNAGYSATGNNLVAVGTGAGAGANSADGQNTLVGFEAGYYGTGTRMTCMGSYAGWMNEGAHRGVFIGEDSGKNSSSTNSQGLGEDTLAYSTGNQCSAIGEESGRASNGGNNVVIGRYSGRDLDGYNVTAIGVQSADQFIEDTGNAQTFDDTDVTVATNRITVTAHGFDSLPNQGGGRTHVNLKFTQGTQAITGMTDGAVMQFEIIDANTLELKGPEGASGVYTITAVNGSGTGHTLTPQTIYNNVTCLGYDSVPDASNQVVLGDSNVTQVKTAGAFTPGTLADASAPNNSIYYSSDQTALCYKDSGGTVKTIDLTAI